MINFSLRTEFSFRETFMPIDRVFDFAEGGMVGIADFNNTIGHCILEKKAKEKGIKPIFAVRVFVVADSDLKARSPGGCWYLLVAMNPDGLKEMYEAVGFGWKCFYYSYRLPLSYIHELTPNVTVIANNFWDPERIDYIGIGPKTPPLIAEYPLPKIAVQDNYFATPEDKTAYHILASGRKRGNGFNFNFDNSTSPQHVLGAAEYYSLLPYPREVISEALTASESLCRAIDFPIPVAPMVKYLDKKASVEDWAEKGAKKLGIDIWSDGPYKERLEREIDIIKQKDFQDYFLIVGDIVAWARKRMLVGPARGSAAGSLLCYLLGITTVDPIVHDLMFERFVDINRPDLPDIDVDFPDDRREEVIDYIVRKYGERNTCHIMNINRVKAKSAIGDAATMLSIPKWEADLVKESIVDRSGGDARAAMAARDTLETTAVGKEFMEANPEMEVAFDLEQHATHFGKHAAGIIICNEEIANYAAINYRENSLMMSKKEIEDKNLLKFDCLGLRTMAILSEAAEIAGMSYDDVYSIPLDDGNAFSVFKEKRLSGIFQFEGKAMAILTGQMPIETFNDVVAVTALARPGPLHSGAAGKFAKTRSGEEEIEYVSNHEMFKEITKDTQGVIIYQEQLMQSARIIGSMSWVDVGQIRRSASKTLGKAHFEKYKVKFMDGAVKNGLKEKEAEDIWNTMVTFGSWGMNKAHAVSYAYISYWCAWFKANHPLAFAVASLNRARGDDSIVKLLRDITEQDGIPYIPFDPDISEEKWTYHEGTLYGPLTGVDGVGPKMAKDIVKARQRQSKWKPSYIKKLVDGRTGYDTLYPCRDLWGNIYSNPLEYGLKEPPSLIANVQEQGEYVIIGQVKNKDLRDLNEYNEVVKRGGVHWDYNNKELKLYVEDDTGAISCKINRFAFDDMQGAALYETLKENETWVLIRGRIRSEWRSITIDFIYDLTGFEA